MRPLKISLNDDINSSLSIVRDTLFAWKWKILIDISSETRQFYKMQFTFLVWNSSLCNTSDAFKQKKAFVFEILWLKFCIDIYSNKPQSIRIIKIGFDYILSILLFAGWS